MKPVFRAFVKRADQPAQTRCQLDAWSVQVGEGDRYGIAYMDVVPTHAYKSVVLPAVRDKQLLQIGLEFTSGFRVLLTGKVGIEMPAVIGMQVVSRMRIEMDRKVERLEMP